jgi:NRAMP (natural resistance-associated macrophage protein)-like metal ion transporter
VSATKRPRRTRSRVDTTRAAQGPGWRAYLRALGPGLVTGASDDDPSGVATYAQAGAQFRFGLLWVSLVTLPLMAAVQEICDRTALSSGKGLGELAVRRFPRGRPVIGLLIVALLVANLMNVTADVVAVGQGMNLLGAGPASLWSLLTGVVVTGLVVRGSFAAVARVFKVLCAALLTYVGVLLVVHADWGSVVSQTLVPHVTLSRGYVLLLVAVLGTTISPYLFFWQSAHRIEELRDEPEGGERAVPVKELSRRTARNKIRTSRGDVFTGMTFSNVVMFAIIVASASTLGAHGGTNIDSAAQAARALEPVAGSLAKVLFALGFIGSGMLAIPVLAGSGSVGMAGLVGKTWGFSKSVREAPFFYGLVALGTLGGTALTLIHVNAIKLLVYVALINGILAAPMLILVMTISHDRAIMGTNVNGRVALILGWAATALMAISAAAYLILTYA